MMSGDYYEGAHRIIRDGAPMRVFIKRTREESARIAAIEAAREAGCGLELDDAPTFSFVPVNRGAAVYRSKAARPVPSAPARSPYYAGKARRYVVGGVPCRTYRDKLNHSFSHWADLHEPMGGFAAWEKRARDWWETETEQGRAERAMRKAREAQQRRDYEAAREAREQREREAREAREAAKQARKAAKRKAKPVKPTKAPARPRKPVLVPMPVPVWREAPDVPADALGGDLGGMLLAA